MDCGQSRPHQYTFIKSTNLVYLDLQQYSCFIIGYVCKKWLSQILNYLLFPQLRIKITIPPTVHKQTASGIWDLQSPITDSLCSIGHTKYQVDVVSGVDSQYGMSIPAIYTTCSPRALCTMTRIYHRFIELIIS